MTLSSRKQQPIIIKRVKKGGHGGHHGGAWKIAYADFVTAMMAFFLLMWLLGSTAQGDLQGIAAYFQSPLKVALGGGSGSGDSSSLIKGGGTDLTRSNGNIRKGEVEAAKKGVNLQALRNEVLDKEAARMRQASRMVEAAVQSNPKLGALKNQLRMDLTNDGLRIQVVDDQGRPMFDAGSAHVKDHMREFLRSMGALLDQTGLKIVLSGHTDAMPYSGGERGYSNWELSSDRANASRREMLAGGLHDDRVLRVLGMSSSSLYDQNDPNNPMNRRISILVLSRIGEERWTRSGETPISETQALEQLLQKQGTIPTPATTPDAATASPER